MTAASARALAPTALALFLVALGLRPQVVGIGPLLPAIRADLEIGYGVAGLLSTIPVLFMGIFALIGPWFGRLVGTERAIAVAIGGIAVLGALRALAPDVPTLLAATLGVGVSVALVGPLLPIVVHRRAPRRAALLTGVYALGIVLGASLGAALAVPLATPFDSWRAPLLAFSFATLVTLAAWLVLERPGGRDSGAPAPPRLPWRRPRAWALALIFGIQSAMFYAVVAWLPTIYVERGWSAADGGVLVALFTSAGLLTTVSAPVLAERWGSRREQLFGWSIVSGAGLLGIVMLPELALLWATVAGLGLGAVFPLALTLPVDVAGRDGHAGGLAAIMLFGGYLMAATAPVAMGTLRELTGGFALPLWLLVLSGAVLAAMSWLALPTNLGRRSSGT